jgi:alanyl-tRNA synthetase
LIDEVRQLNNQLRERDRTIDELRLSLATTDIDRLAERSVTVDGTRVLATRVPAGDRETMLRIGGRLRDAMQSGVIVLASEVDGQPALLAMVTTDQVGRGLSAGKLIQEIAPIVGGRGGGRPELAQGGGSDASKLDEALASVVPIVKRQVSG